MWHKTNWLPTIPAAKTPIPTTAIHLVCIPRPKSIANDLREFIASRLEKINPFQESSEYKRRHELAQGLYEELCALLPADGRAKLREYADALGTAHYLETELFCERAFLDGVRLMARALCAQS